MVEHASYLITFNLTFSFFVWKIAPVSDNRLPSTSHFEPNSRLDDNCGSTFGLFWFAGLVFSWKFAEPGGVKDEP